MRVVAGEKRGTILNSPIDFDTRPTTDRVKESLFGIIQFNILDKYILDLFAGSGALGIEAISRGAKQGVFVDNAQNAITIIKNNLIKTNFIDKSNLIYDSYENAIKLFKGTKKFDIVFIDPPYDKDLYNKAVDCLIENEVLNENAVLILESNKPLEITNKNVYLKKQKKYSACYVTIFVYGEKP